MKTNQAEEEGLNIEELRKFVCEFKVFRARHSLSQTDVSKMLSEMPAGPTESNSKNKKTAFYSQSAICR